MIVSDITHLGIAATRGGPAVRWSCLARRGMLHSECEAVDYLELPPGAAVSMDGRAGVEEAWYVLAGTAELEVPRAGGPCPEQPCRAEAGDLVLRPVDSQPTVRNAASDTPLRLLLISVLPRPVTDRLPGRSPVAKENQS